MPFHSQVFQDQLLNQEVFKGFKNGFFVEVGAHDGITLSNSAFFEEDLGWTGINIEPNPDTFSRLIQNRPNNINLQVAVCEQEGEMEFIQNNEPNEMLCGLTSFYSEDQFKRLDKELTEKGGESAKINVKTRRLDNIFREHGVKRIHYLSIDTEGAEFTAIKSINFDEVYIDVIGFEVNYLEEGRKIVEYLEPRGYLLFCEGGDFLMIQSESEFFKNLLISG
jgi:FkbM family methyltransferase